MSDLPKVSVVMPVYNGEDFIREAIDSVLLQTFGNFEFLIIDDGSVDNCVEIINSYQDKRIRLIQNQENLGIALSLNIGLELARGEYIARMDADDVCLPKRLEKQVAFMDSNLEVGISGTFIETFGDGVPEIVWNYPTKSDEIWCLLLFNSVLVHPSVIMRQEVLKKYNLFYSAECLYAEDYEFWVRCVKYTKLANIDVVLLRLRQHFKKVGSVYSVQQHDTAHMVRHQQIKDLGITPTDTEVDLHNQLSSLFISGDLNFLINTEKWLLKLRKFNTISLYYPELAFSNVLAMKWLEICSNSTKNGFIVWKLFFNSELIKVANLPFKKIVLFTIKCICSFK